MLNLFEKLPSPGFQEEQVTLLHEDKNCRVERILSCGQSSPEGFWYDQEENEWLTLVQGEAVLTVEQREVRLQAGDTLFLPKHQKHRVESTSKNPICIWICVFYP